MNNLSVVWGRVDSLSVIVAPETMLDEMEATRDDFRSDTHPTFTKRSTSLSIEITERLLTNTTSFLHFWVLTVSLF